jgi:DNA-binding transcriptional ArsR family regulator
MTGEALPDDVAVDAVLAALADPTRRHLLDLLSSHGEATATNLSELVPISRQAIVKHLGCLDDAHLVSSRRVGREVRYSVTSSALSSTAMWMAGLADRWDRRLARLKQVAEHQEE